MGQHHAVLVQEESAQCDADSTVLCQFSSSAPDVVQCQTGDLPRRAAIDFSEHSVGMASIRSRRLGGEWTHSTGFFWSAWTSSGQPTLSQHWAAYSAFTSWWWVPNSELSASRGLRPLIMHQPASISHATQEGVPLTSLRQMTSLKCLSVASDVGQSAAVEFAREASTLVTDARATAAHGEPRPPPVIAIATRSREGIIVDLLLSLLRSLTSVQHRNQRVRERRSEQP